MNTATIFLLLHCSIVVITVLRVMLRPHREPAARIAWIAVIAGLPFFGIIAYLFFGEINIGRQHIEKRKRVKKNIPKIIQPQPKETINHATNIPTQSKHLFKLGKSINGFDPVGGNTAKLMPNSKAMIDSLVNDIDTAKNHVHLLFYIWLPDNSGKKVVEALKHAAMRGIQCRVMADSVGSSTLISSKYWQAMKKCGVHLVAVLPIGNPIFRVLTSRIDLRNHRKIVVIDNVITYCGSQNCADAEFLIKPKFAPWEDAVLRIEGPITRQNQHLFASDWMIYTDEDISSLLRQPISTPHSGFIAQIIGTGPDSRSMAMSQIFVSLISAARKELIITTPYFVPDEAIESALQAASYRGVQTTIILPAKNDSWIVQSASRSYYQELLAAGVEIYEYIPGLLHTKSLTFDSEFAMIGSANVDRRSFDLNYENNILIADNEIVSDIIKRQQQYISQATLITTEAVNNWSPLKRLWNNTVAMLGPIL